MTNIIIVNMSCSVILRYADSQCKISCLTCRCPLLECWTLFPSQFPSLGDPEPNRWWLRRALFSLTRMWKVRAECPCSWPDFVPRPRHWKNLDGGLAWESTRYGSVFIPLPLELMNQNTLKIKITEQHTTWWYALWIKNSCFFPSLKMSQIIIYFLPYPLPP